MSPVWWLVQSPEMYTVIPITDDGRGPSEPGCDFALVQAPTAHQAKWAAYHLWEKHGADWPSEREDWHPLHGVKATRWEDIGEGVDPIPTAHDLEDWAPFVSSLPEPEPAQ